MSFSFKDNLKGYADPFKYKDSNGNWQTLFFAAEVTEVVILGGRVALPVWAEVPVFDSVALEAYRVWKTKWYDASEVAMHIQTLEDPYYHGVNPVEGFAQVIQPNLCLASDRAPYHAQVKREMEGFLKFYARDNNLELNLESETDPSRTAYCDVIMDALLPMIGGENQMIEFSGGSFNNDLWDHGIVLLSTGWDSLGGLPLIRGGVRPRNAWQHVSFVEVRHDGYNRYTESTRPDGSTYHPIYKIRVGRNTSRNAGTIDTYTLGTVVYSNDDENPHWDAEYDSTNGDTMSSPRAAVMEALGVPDFVDEATLFPNGSFSFGDGSIATRAGIQGYIPWPTRTAVAIYGLPSNPGGISFLQDVELSGCVDCHLLGESYTALAASGPDNAREALLRIGDSLSTGHKYAYGCTFAGRGTASKATFSATMMGGMAEEAGQLGEFMSRIVSPTRPDGEAGDFTYQVWEDQNNDEYFSEPFWRGIWFFVEPPVAPTVSVSVLRWEYSTVDSQWHCINTDTSTEVDQATIQSEWDKGLYPGLVVSEDAQAAFDLTAHASVAIWLQTDFPNVYDYSPYNAGSIAPPELGSTTIASMRMMPDYYLMPGMPGFDRNRAREPEAILLGTAMGNKSVQGVCSGHLAGAMGWSNLTQS